MSFGLGLFLMVVGLGLIEALNLMLGLWSDRIAGRLRRDQRSTPREKLPWSDRRGT